MKELQVEGEDWSVVENTVTSTNDRDGAMQPGDQQFCSG